MFSIFVLLALRIISSAPFGNVRGINELPCAALPRSVQEQRLQLNPFEIVHFKAGGAELPLR